MAAKERSRNDTPRSTIVSEKTARLRDEILKLRLQGMSFQEIADHLGGYHWSYIRKQYMKAIQSIYVDNVDDLRKQEQAKLDILEKSVYKVLNAFHPMVANGTVVRDIREDENGNPLIDENGNPVTVRLVDAAPVLTAVSKALQVMERRARLWGLDAPTKTALTDPSGKAAAPAVMFYLPHNNRDTDVGQEAAGEGSGESSDSP